MFDFNIITLSMTNCYLVKVKSGYMLIDCGNTHDKQKFIKSLNRLGIAIDDIIYLLLTHHHNDHCGLLTFLTTTNPKIRVILSKNCAEYLKVGMHHKHKDEMYSNTKLKYIINIYSRLDKNRCESFPPYLIRFNDIVIEHDNTDILTDLSLNGKILLTPGHTEDSMSLIICKTAFIGDAARNMLNFTGTPYLPILLYDHDICIKSWSKLISEGVDTFYPSHGNAFKAKQLLIYSN